MAYVPPALRQKQLLAGAATKDSDKPASFAATRRHRLEQLSRDRDVHNHYWPAVDAGETPHTLSSGTLHSSASEPDKLKYIMLWYRANPDWRSNRIIYVKTNLQLLPAHEAFGIGENERSGEENIEPTCLAPDGSVDLSALPASRLGPIAVFEQAASQLGGFSFVGYHRINRLQFLAPGSHDVIHMLEKKFSATNRHGMVVQKRRSSESWRASIRHWWAEVQLEKDDEADKRLPAPEIETHSIGQRESKSVNELLKELRMEKPGTDNAVP